jgi:predicted nucleic-acid-binding protein
LIGLDTNVLVRLLTGDDAAQRLAAKVYIDLHCSPDDPAFLNWVVLIETVRVLESVYAYSRDQIADAINALLRLDVVTTNDPELVRAALKEYRGGADFADALIAKGNAAKGCTITITFDKKAARRPAHFTLIGK